MTDKSKKLSETAHALLTAAAARDDHLIRPPQLPGAAARQVVRSLLNAGFAEEISAPIDDFGFAWRKAEDDANMMLRATHLGLACLLAEGGSSVVPPTAATLVEPGVDADDVERTELPIVGDRPIDEPQPSLDATKAPSQPP